jgi:hypothetical protein
VISHRILRTEGGFVQQTLSSRYALLQFFPIIQYVGTLKGLDYVTKPIPDMGVVENALRKVLERVRLTRQNRLCREHLEELNRERRTLEQLQADEEAGRNIQFQLLPPEERRVGRYQLARRLYPSMYLSGDFVDYFAIDSLTAELGIDGDRLFPDDVTVLTVHGEAVHA